MVESANGSHARVDKLQLMSASKVFRDVSQVDDATVEKTEAGLPIIRVEELDGAIGDFLNCILSDRPSQLTIDVNGAQN